MAISSGGIPEAKRAEEHKQLLVASCIKEIIRLENVSWLWTADLWAGAISLEQDVGLPFLVTGHKIKVELNWEEE